MDYKNKIEDYIWGRLDESEKKQFEAQLATDSELAEEVAVKRLVKQALILNDREYWREKGASWSAIAEQNLAQKKSILKEIPIKINRWWPAVAASVILLVTIFFLLPDSPSAYEAVVIEAINNTPFDTRLKSADPIDLQTSEQRLRRDLTTAYTRLEEKSYKSAYRKFEKIINDDEADSYLLQNAQFYQALAALGKEDVATAKGILERIIGKTDPRHKFNQEAEQVLGRVRQLESEKE